MPAAQPAAQLLAAAVALAAAAAAAPMKGFVAPALMPWQDYTLPTEERLDDLMSRLSLNESIQQVWSIAPAIPALGISAYNWRSNCVHGWSQSGGAWLSNETWTTFPGPLALGASFDRVLLRSIGSVTSTEGRALHNLAVARSGGASPEARGLNCFAPQVNLLRDFRWGRNQEVLGECPFLIGELATQYTLGLQVGEAPQYVKVGGCAKHFAVHDGPEDERESIVYNVSLWDAWDTYLPAFRAVVTRGGVSQIMCAYSGVNASGGAPDCANAWLLQTVLREAMGFQGMVISDNGALEFITDPHHFTPDALHAAGVALNAGTDSDLGYDAVYPENLWAAVQGGLTTAAAVVQAARRNMRLRMQLGEFDPDWLVPYRQLGWSDLDTPAHQALNLQAAREGLVLLKNAGGALPLAPPPRGGGLRLAVVGPSINDTAAMLGNYAGIPSRVVTPLAALRAAGASVASVAWGTGCGAGATELQRCPNTSAFADALAAAAGADAIVFVGGLEQSLASEGHDWTDNSACDGVPTPVGDLPGCQSQLVAALAAAHPATPLVLVTLAGSPLLLGATAEAHVAAHLSAGYPGSLGGLAIAEALLGLISPGGKLPYSIPSDPAALPPMSEPSMTAGPGRTYRYAAAAGTATPFGFGLSYASFAYSDLVLDARTIAPCGSVRLNVTVTNTGAWAGSAFAAEVVFAFVEFPPGTGTGASAGFVVPTRLLRDFARVEVPPGAPTTVALTLDAAAFALVSPADGLRYVMPGTFTVYVGGQQPHQAKTSGQPPLAAAVTVTGAAPAPFMSCPGATQ